MTAPNPPTTEARQELLEERLQEVQTARPMPLAFAKDVQDNLFLYLGSQVAIADMKASMILAADALLITITLQLYQKDMLLAFSSAAPPLDRIGYGLIYLVLASLVASFVFALLVAYPRMPSSPKPNLFYFVDIIHMKMADYQRLFLQQSETEIVDQMVQENYIVSRLVYKKFFNVQISFRWLILAGLLWATGQALIMIPG